MRIKWINLSSSAAWSESKGGIDAVEVATYCGQIPLPFLVQMDMGGAQRELIKDAHKDANCIKKSLAGMEEGIAFCTMISTSYLSLLPGEDCLCKLCQPLLRRHRGGDEGNLYQQPHLDSV